jgi:hypothetical protein
LGLNKEGEEEHHRHQNQQHPQLPASSSRVMPLNKGARPTSSDVYSWIPAGLSPDQVKYSNQIFFPPGWRIVWRSPVNKSRHLERRRRRRLFLYLHWRIVSHLQLFLRIANEETEKEMLEGMCALLARMHPVVNPSLKPSISPLAGAT